jgi:hypothetical protein
MPCCSSRSKIVSASFFVNHFLTGLFTTSPDDVAAVQNERFNERLRRHLGKPVVKHPEFTRDAAQHRCVLV